MRKTPAGSNKDVGIIAHILLAAIKKGAQISAPLFVTREILRTIIEKSSSHLFI